MCHGNPLHFAEWLISSLVNPMFFQLTFSYQIASFIKQFAIVRKFFLFIISFWLFGFVFYQQKEVLIYHPIKAKKGQPC